MQHGLSPAHKPILGCISQEKGTLRHKNYKTQGVFWHSFKLHHFCQKCEFWGHLFLVIFGGFPLSSFQLRTTFFLGKSTFHIHWKNKPVTNGFVKHQVRVPLLCQVPYCSNSKADLVQNHLLSRTPEICTNTFLHTSPHYESFSSKRSPTYDAFSGLSVVSSLICCFSIIQHLMLSCPFLLWSAAGFVLQCYVVSI